MRSANWITAYAGVLIGGAYVVGSLARERLVPSIPAPRSTNDRGGPNPVRVSAIEISVTVLWASFTYVIIDRFAPGTTSFRDFSAVGFLSPKALTVWESVALWSALGVICGLMAPFRFQLRSGGFGLGSTGVAPGAAVLLLYSPITFFVASSAWFGAQSILRPRSALLVALAIAVASEWLLSMIPQTIVRTGWGVIHGPESTLWVTALAGALAARQSHVSSIQSTER